MASEELVVVDFAGHWLYTDSNASQVIGHRAMVKYSSDCDSWCGGCEHHYGEEMLCLCLGGWLNIWQPF